MATAQRDALARMWSDPRTWARALVRKPEDAAWFEGREFEDGTIGAGVKDVLRAEDEEGRSAEDNVLPFDRPRRD